MYSFIKSKFIFILIAIVFVLAIIFTTNYQIYYITGSSMEPTINQNSFIVVKERQSPKYGDIIVIDFGDDKEKVAKRIIGVPGDEIKVSDHVYINGVKYISSRCDVDTCIEQGYKLSENEFFVIGDNYLQSIDSRTYGPIELKQILGIYN